MNTQGSDHNGPRPLLADRAIEGLLTALVCFAPLAMGAVHAWSEMICLALACAIVACLALRRLSCRGARGPWHWALVPAGALVALAALQLTPLPPWVHEVLSTQTGSIGQGVWSPQEWRPLSLYPHATARALRNALIPLAVLAAVLTVYRTPGRVKRLLATVSIVGALVALVAMLQVATQTSRIYWLIPVGVKPIANSGPFVNHSHFSQYMNLSIAAMLGLLLVKLRETVWGGRLSLPEIIDRLGRRDLCGVWALAGAMVLAASAVFLSLSRAGAGALLLAGTLTAVVLARKRGLSDWRWLVALLLALLSVALALYVGFDALYGRFASLCAEDVAGVRPQVWRGTIEAWKHWPILGTGLGTHAVIYPAFGGEASPHLAAQADNEYLQMLEETGIVGLGLLLALGGLAGRAFVRYVRHEGGTIRVASYGLAMGLAAIMLQNATDFGLRLPAISTLAAVVVGLLVALGDWPALTRPPGPTRRNATRAGALLALAVVTVGSVQLLASADSARRAQGHYHDAVRLERLAAGQQWARGRHFHTLLWHAEQAVRAEPDNAHYRYWLAAWQWRGLRAQIASTRADGRQYRSHVRALVGELHETRRLCATWAAPLLLAGQIEYHVLGEGRGAEHIRLAHRLDEGDPAGCFAMAAVEAMEGRPEQSVHLVVRSARVDRRLGAVATAMYVDVVHRPDLAVRVARPNVRSLLETAWRLRRSVRAPQTREALDQVDRLLLEQCRRRGALTVDVVATADYLQGSARAAEALGLLAGVETREDFLPGWRLQYAALLAGHGRWDQAWRQVVRGWRDGCGRRAPLACAAGGWSAGR